MGFIATCNKRHLFDGASEKMETCMPKHALTMKKIQHDQKIDQLNDLFAVVRGQKHSKHVSNNDS